ncbi:hypothetical protein ACH5A3_44525 [Streptomyces echinatus]|uniref:hypothetical protein n=1 Tax=Streptomyces echinatus TaxID=67293 RepID=UPI00379B13CA
MPHPIALYMSMSLDGFIAGPDDRPGQRFRDAVGRRVALVADGSSGLALIVSE